MTHAPYSVVVPTVGRPSLSSLLAALRSGTGPEPVEVVVVDDRSSPATALDLGEAASWPLLRVLLGTGRGPAAARNVGWRATSAPWVAFLDDDVLPPPDWAARLAADLAGLPDRVAGSQGRLRVPLPADRRPTDWERGTAGLEGARWATADMAYRRSALARVGGFDERFGRAYREDAELALRILRSGLELVRGERVTTHPVRPAGRWASLAAQRGNADDALMRRLHGRSWRADADAPAGRFARHLAVTGAGLVAVGGLLSGRLLSGRVPSGRLPSRARLARLVGLGAAARPVGLGAAARLVGLGAAAAWAAGTAEFGYVRIAPGPRTPGEVATMLATSAVIPPAAVAHRLRGELRWRGARPVLAPLAVLFDRDGTLVQDVPYNGDPDRVRPVPGALAALTWLRGQGVPVGVVTNQSAVGRGLITVDQVDAVNARVAELLGPFDDIQVCPHAPADGCGCRKPAPGMVLAAADALGVPAQRCVLIGDIGADLAAAHAAGARAVLVPNATTRPEEIAGAPAVAPDLLSAVRLAVAGGAR
ncbi:MAG TPA: HAD-IIIA family hydrolase [Mycobacteriales bacterium]|nr:HAD-IIIA family hydrolase [Mycobacteriales bacterium]